MSKKLLNISVSQAKQCLTELNLKSGDYFSNTEPSELCYEWRMETGYYLPKAKERILKLTTTKDENDKEITVARLELSLEALGIDPEQRQESIDTEAQNNLIKLSEICGFDPIDLKDINPY